MMKMLVRKKFGDLRFTLSREQDEREEGDDQSVFSGGRRRCRRPEVGERCRVSSGRVGVGCQWFKFEANFQKLENPINKLESEDFEKFISKSIRPNIQNLNLNPNRIEPKNFNPKQLFFFLYNISKYITLNLNF